MTTLVWILVGVAMAGQVCWYFEWKLRRMYREQYLYFKEQASGLLDDFTAVASVNEEAAAVAQERIRTGKHWPKLPPDRAISLASETERGRE